MVVEESKRVRNKDLHLLTEQNNDMDSVPVLGVYDSFGAFRLNIFGHISDNEVLLFFITWGRSKCRNVNLESL